jgi:dTDP-4-amino-4,6-dideoxygalactose transaminase
VAAGWGGLVVPAQGAHAGIAQRLCATYHADHALLVDSGTAALTLALAAASKRAPGRPVALPAYCCYDVATAADGAGAPVVLYDVEPDTLSPDPASLERALARRPAAVVVAHLYGVPVDAPALHARLAGTDVLLIEDAAQAAGARWAGWPVGAVGDLTVLSFGRGKGMTAGRGGALLARGEVVAAMDGASRAAVAGPRAGWWEALTLSAQWLLGRPSLYGLPAALPFLGLGETRYRSPAPVRALSRVAARTLCRTLDLADREAEVRRRHAARLLEAHGPGLRAVRVASGAAPGYLRLPFLARANADSAVDAAARRLGVMPGYPRALGDLTGFGSRLAAHEEAGYPGARALASRLLTAPTHALLAERDVAALQAWLRAVA